MSDEPNDIKALQAKLEKATDIIERIQTAYDDARLQLKAYKDLDGSLQFQRSECERLQAEAQRLTAENERLREALKFYADGDHFSLSDEDAWDTVSGEPTNWWCDEAGTAMVEDGSLAKGVLGGASISNLLEGRVDD